MADANLILIGLRGSGKSTIGRHVAERLRRPFVDLDHLTPEILSGATVAEVWAKHGEPAFRAAETQALLGVLQQLGQVIALGGGTPTAPGAASALRDHRAATGACLLYLHAGPAELRARLTLADNTHRPVLTSGSSNPLTEIEAIYNVRDAKYQELADTVIEVGGRTVADVVDMVVAALCER